MSSPVWSGVCSSSPTLQGSKEGRYGLGERKRVRPPAPQCPLCVALGGDLPDHEA